MAIKKCIKLALVLLCAFHTAHGQGEKLLSQSDEGYLEIEKFQEEYCQANPVRGCVITPEEWIAGMTKLWIATYGVPPSDTMMRRRSRRFSTRYEIPGIFSIIYPYYQEVVASAKELGYVTKSSIKLGTLPIGEVNASTPVGDSSKHLSAIFINTRFFSFAEEITKQTAKTLAVSNRGVIDTRTSAFTNYITKNPESISNFLATMRAFNANGDLSKSYTKPDLRTSDIINAFTRGMELFAIAHEYGHIYLGHNISNGNALRLSPKRVYNETYDKTEWEQEMAADLIAFHIIRKIYSKNVDKHEQIENIALLAAPRLYFVANQSLDEEQAIRDKRNIDTLTQKEARVFPQVKSCFNQPVPVMVNSMHNIVDNDFSARHPHYNLRLMLSRELLRFQFEKESDKEIAVMYELLERNLLLMWDVSKFILYKNSLINKSKLSSSSY